MGSSNRVALAGTSKGSSLTRKPMKPDLGNMVINDEQSSNL